MVEVQKSELQTIPNSCMATIAVNYCNHLRVDLAYVMFQEEERSDSEAGHRAPQGYRNMVEAFGEMGTLSTSQHPGTQEEEEEEEEDSEVEEMCPVHPSVLQLPS